MDARQAFKFGFMSHCIEDGIVTPAGMLKRAREALEKRAVPGLWGLALGEAGEKALGLVGDLGAWAIPVLAAAPPLAGAALGHLAGNASDISDFDVDEAKRQEIIDEYHRQAQRLNRESAARRNTGAPSRVMP